MTYRRGKARVCAGVGRWWEAVMGVWVSGGMKSWALRRKTECPTYFVSAKDFVSPLSLHLRTQLYHFTFVLCIM